MRIPVLKGIIKRRLLVNFRVDLRVMQKLLPHPFRPKVHNGHAIAGICLIKLEQVRPAGLPAALGISSENAAHRVAVEWTDADGAVREGVFIPRRDTGSWLNQMAGGRLFPGQHHAAEFIVADDGHHIDLKMEAEDGQVSLQIHGEEADSLPVSSCFDSLQEASAFFEGGCLGYSAREKETILDGLVLRTVDWRVGAFAVSAVRSSYFENKTLFPEGSVQFDHALIMRDVLHEWHSAESLDTAAEKAVSAQSSS